MIEWKEGSVFYGGGRQHEARKNKVFGCELVSFCRSSYHDIKSAVKCNDFQLNEPREGYYIPKSELDTEEKYNQAVEVFGLFGFYRNGKHCNGYDSFMDNDAADVLCSYVTCDKADNTKLLSANELASYCKVKITFDQLMAIGELKRKMNERESEFIGSRGLDIEMIKKVAGFETERDTTINNAVVSIRINGEYQEVKPTHESVKSKTKPKSKEAYRILESMGIEWDNVKGKWFKVSKEWL